MADYISREVAITKLTALEIEKQGATMADARRALANMPAADVIEVVRCGQCKYKRNPDEFERKYLISTALICTNSDFLYDGWNAVLANDFCSYGERK